MGQVLILFGAFLVFGWGVAHLFPTMNVVAGFGSIGQDNRRIILMEWIVEGVALIFAGALVAVVSLIDPGSAVSLATYLLTAGFLVVMAIVSFFTGFRIRFAAFRMCPVIFLSAALLVTIGPAIV